MARYGYDRLSAQDNTFLAVEGPTTPMHVSAIQIFEAAPLRGKDGGIDIAAIRDAYESVLHLVPRYRQKLDWVPIAGRAVWVDDPHFNLDYHIRHVALPQPGDVEDLKRVAGRVMAHHLDRTHPLWELWVVEGLAGDRFATIAKTHHCMIDGVSGVEIAQKLLSVQPQQTLPDKPLYVPRPRPSGAELLRDDVMRQVGLPLRLLRGAREMRAEVEDLRTEVEQRLSGLNEFFAKASSTASETPLNGKLSPHRHFDWHVQPLADVKAVRKVLDCTVNDVVLATVTEAVRRYLQARQVDPAPLTFRASTPVNVRSGAEAHDPGNRVSMWILDLPVGEPDRRRQVDALHECTRALKESRQAQGMDMLMAASEFAPPAFFSLGSRLASGPINIIVTNVPGPQFPLYMLGAKLEAMIPQVPLIENIGLGVALLSYDGNIHWGFTADYELVPDLEDFVRYVDESFAELATQCGVTSSRAVEGEPSFPGLENAEAQSG